MICALLFIFLTIIYLINYFNNIFIINLIKILSTNQPV